MERRFESEIKEIRNQILAMAGYVEQAMDRATQALLERSPAKLNEVFPLEQKINQAHKDVDNTCLGILARQAPVAADLRLILAIVKINTDLERMGDQAENLAKNTGHYLKHEPVEIAQKLPKMTELVRAMVRKSLDAFVNSDVALAKQVLESDDAVDEFKIRLGKELTDLMKSNPAKIEASLNLILITRNLERVADHATNIAEDVIFVKTGDDVRHGAGRDTSTEKSGEKASDKAGDKK